MTLASRLRAPVGLAFGTFYGVLALGLVAAGTWQPVGQPQAPARPAQVAKDQSRVPAALEAPWAEEEPYQPGGSYAGPGWHWHHRHHHTGPRARLGPPIANTHHRRGRR